MDSELAATGGEGEWSHFPTQSAALETSLSKSMFLYYQREQEVKAKQELIPSKGETSTFPCIAIHCMRRESEELEKWTMDKQAVALTRELAKTEQLKWRDMGTTAARWGMGSQTPVGGTRTIPGRRVWECQLSLAYP